MSADSKGVRLHLIRHARAQGNRAHRLNGWHMDVGLTALGRRQAHELARRAGPKPDVLLCSPMKRALSTARPLARRWNLPITIADEAYEHDMGDWTGRFAPDLIRTHPDYFFKNGQGEMTYYLKRVPGGESWADILKRARRFLARVRRQYAGKRVVLVSHGVFISACVCLAEGLRPPKLWDLHIKNTHAIELRI